MSSSVKLVTGDAGRYSKTDLLLLSSLLESMWAGEYDGVSMDSDEGKALRDDFRSMSQAIGRMLFSGCAPEQQMAAEPAEEQVSKRPSAAEPWRARYGGRPELFSEWFDGLAHNVLVSLGSKGLQVRQACMAESRFRDADGAFCIDVNAASVLCQRAATDPATQALIDPAVPAYASADMLMHGRLLIAPTPAVLEILEQYDVFRSGVFGMCRVSLDGSTAAEHMSGVRVTLDDLETVSDGRMSVYDVLYPDLEPEELNPAADITEQELHALSRHFPGEWLFAGQAGDLELAI